MASLLNRPLSRRTLLAGSAAAGVGLTGLAAGCTSDDGAETAAPSGELRKTTYMTAFGLPGREAAGAVAKGKGFFTEAGLDVEILAGAAGEKNYAAMESGQVDFGAVDWSGAVPRYAKGGKAVKIVAAIHSQTLISMVTLPSTGITGARQLIGKRIGVGAGAAPKSVFPAYASAFNIEPAELKTVQWQEVAPDQVAGLLIAGKVDAIGLFVAGTPGVRKAAIGKGLITKEQDLVVLPYSDGLTDLMGNVLTARTQLIQEQPQLVRDFTNALMKGLDYAVNNPEEAAKILAEQVPETDPEVAAAELVIMKNYVYPQDTTKPVGFIDVARAAKGAAILEGVLQLPPVDVGDMIDFNFVPGGTPVAASAAAK
ncbi:ABC transporter substrate-binding protein [Catenuloplanes indicus]|uniref:Thiamine pyrimidine synthase n=1 Tax=Catenuloplanes indicus TaxID=137267 RepID=A0AAE4AW31_9ACTN|nr:ABC transporter substrate-binding protein [Catenuloplanes indicus]MDQ0364652.1 NitT/TauT family transport system substrate-binding protein [Catenuloplanes indicus]